jgi:5-deoxy-glucuronate isomerase
LRLSGYYNVLSPTNEAKRLRCHSIEFIEGLTSALPYGSHVVILEYNTHESNVAPPNMHIPSFDNENNPLVDSDDSVVPLNYFNIVKLTHGESFTYTLSEYETCIVPESGTVDVVAGDISVDGLGGRIDVWSGSPEGFYVPPRLRATITSTSEAAQVFIVGARYDGDLEPFVVREDEIDIIELGSDETKTKRIVKHILGKNQDGKVGRLLVSEQFTVGLGSWFGYPSYKHEKDMWPDETLHHATLFFRFNSKSGTGVQLIQKDETSLGTGWQVGDGSTICLNGGYHPCCVLPGYDMYALTIKGGKSRREVRHSYKQTDKTLTYIGIMDMVGRFSS